MTSTKCLFATVISFLFFVAAILPCLGLAQREEVRMDSLKQVISKAKKPAEKLILLNDMAADLWHRHPEVAFEFTHEALQLAELLKNLEEEAKALTNLGIGHTIHGNFEASMKSLNRAIDIANSLKSNPLLSYIYNQVGNNYLQLSDYSNAEKYYLAQIELILPELEKNRAKARAYRNLGQLYNQKGDFSKAFEFNFRAIRFKKLLPEADLSSNWHQLGEVHKEAGNPDSALFYFEKALDGVRKQKEYSEEAEILYHIGEIHFFAGEYPKAIELFYQAMDIYEAHGYQMGRAMVFYRMGSIFINRGNLNKALDYLIKSLNIHEEIGNKYQIALVTDEIGALYQRLGNYHLATQYRNRAFTLMKELGHPIGISTSLNGLGLLAYMQGEYRTALDYHTEALKIRRSSGNVRLIAASYYNMAIAMEGLGYAREALRYHKLSLELEEQIGNKRGEIISYNGMGRLYTSLSEFTTAEKYLKLAEKMIFEIGAEDELRETYLFYSDLYERQGNTAKALDYFKKYKVVTDSVFNESTLRQITEIQALYEIEKKEKEIALLNQQNEWNELQMAQQAGQIRQQRMLLVLGAGFILLLAGFAVIIYNYYLQKSRTNEELTKLNKEILEQQEEITAQSEELREANDMIVGFNTELKLKVEHQTYELRQAYQDLDTFFYRSSHDFRRPLTTLMGLSKVAQLSVSDPVSLDLFQKVNETVVAMDRMLSKLHAFSNLGIEDLPIETIDFETKLEAFKKAFSDEIQQKNLTFTYQLELEKPVRTYALLIHVLLENLIENAIIFNSHQGRVHVEIGYSAQNLQVEVSDNGIGISQELLESVFEMYLRGSEQSKGNGLGLYLANKVVTRLKGRISVESILNEGTTFRVTIPIT